MGKKNHCLNLLKIKLFGSGASLKAGDNCGKEKVKKEWAQEGPKSSCPPSMGSPRVPPDPTPKVLGKTLSEQEEEQSKHAMAVAIATAAAAEAAVAAAQAAAQVVRLTGKGGSYHQLDLSRRESAATRIQSVFRGYLARKALRALKGLVKLQALIRGHMVRRQAESAFRSMQALQRIQSQACSRKVKMTEDEKSWEHRLEVQRHADVVREIDMASKKQWNGCQLSKQQTEIFLSRQQATFKQERTKEYYLDQRDKRLVKKPTSLTAVKRCNLNNENVEWSWIARWIDMHGSENSSASSMDQNSLSDKQIAGAKACFDTLFKEQEVQNKLNVRESRHRRRVMRSQSPVPNQRKLLQRVIIRDDESYASSTASLPGYMLYTESAKAKARSSSTPRQRISMLPLDKTSSFLSQK